MRKKAEADKLMLESDKYTQSSWFKKPQWDLAAAGYKKAANMYRVAKDEKACIDALLKAANALQMNQQLFNAARILQDACKYTRDIGRANHLIEQSCALYTENGNSKAAATLWMTGAQRNMKVSGYDDAIRMIEQAQHLYQCDDDLYNEIKCVTMKLQCVYDGGDRTSVDYPAILKYLTALTEMYPKVDQLANLHSTITSLVVVHLCNGDMVSAERAYREGMSGENGYLASDTYTYCGELLECFSEHDQESLVRLQKSSKFNYLETPIVRLMKTLIVPGANLEGEEEGEIDMT